MKKLAERTDFMIKNADKGEAVVIMNTYDYQFHYFPSAQCLQ